MTPAEILPDLTADELTVLADWISSLPLHVYITDFVYQQAKDIAYEFRALADLRRKA